MTSTTGISPIEMHIVDVFSRRSFGGSTCAVCLLPDWLPDALLLSIARQNLFAETAFVVPTANPDKPELRWFTVSTEVAFCGYGTLAAGFVCLARGSPSRPGIVFATRQYGDIPVRRHNGLYELAVPPRLPLSETSDDAVRSGLGAPEAGVMLATARNDLLIRYGSEAEIRAVAPDFARLMANPYFGYILTAPGDSADYAYRYFSPRLTNIWEDPANGASQSTLAPYWYQQLGKTALTGHAVSTRGGEVFCRYNPAEDDQVHIGGHITPYCNGQLTLTA